MRGGSACSMGGGGGFCETLEQGAGGVLTGSRRGVQRGNDSFEYGGAGI
ncbi:hypothetical protein OG612_45315 (plasmid) [Streptomyces sp. NBC_01527]